VSLSDTHPNSRELIAAIPMGLKVGIDKMFKLCLVLAIIQFEGLLLLILARFDNW
jgi:hypothetical protein